MLGGWTITSGVLLLAESTLLAIVVVTALFALALVVLGLATIVLLARAPERKAPIHHEATAALPSLSIRPSGLRSTSGLRGVEIDVPTRHVDHVISALRASGWTVRETGEVVATDEDEEGLTTISVDLPVKRGSGEEIR